jgi:hypothetical protein
MIYIYICGGLIGLLILWALGSYLVVRNIEEPAYVVLEKKPNYELRQYDPSLLATTEVSGTYQTATNAGFRIIADYIFGNNTAATGISMTTPVLEEPASASIAMTTPVLEESTTDGRRRIAFVLPSKYTLETLPKPNDKRVLIVATPERTMAALRFSWYPTAGRVEKKKKELITALEAAGVTITGEAQVARYNPPLSMPLVLRNEILIPVKK